METKSENTHSEEINQFQQSVRPLTSQVKHNKKQKRLRTPGLIIKNRKLQRPNTVSGNVRDLGDYHGAASDWTLALRETGTSHQRSKKNQKQINGNVKFVNNAFPHSFQERERPSTTGKKPFTPFPLRPLTGKEFTPRNGPSRAVSPNKTKSSQSQPLYYDNKEQHISTTSDSLATNPWETNLRHQVPRPHTAAVDVASSTPNKRFITTAPKENIVGIRAPVSAAEAALQRRKSGDQKSAQQVDKRGNKIKSIYAIPLQRQKSAAGSLYRFNESSEQFERKRPITWDVSLPSPGSVTEGMRSKHRQDPSGYEEMVDILGSHRMARQSQALYAKLQEEEAIRFFEQWRSAETVLNLAKREMKRWGTSGDNIQLNSVQRQMAKSFLPPPNKSIIDEAEDPDIYDTKKLAHASRASFATGTIEIVWSGVQKIKKCALFNTMMLQVFNLVSVRLPGNKLKRIPLWFCKTFHRIRDLHLGSNDLIELPNNLGNMTSLLELNITHNLVPQIPKSIEHLTRLVYLDASDNELASLPEQIVGCQRLVELHVDNNNLIRLPSTIRKMSRLQALTCDANRIGTLALIPSLERLKGNGNADPTNLLWEHRELEDGKIVYINRFTGEMQEENPIEKVDCESTEKSQNKNDAPTLISLAAADKTVWELKFDFRSGQSYYFNNLTRIKKLEAPHAIDTIGKTANLRRLVMSSNVLMHLPRSLGKMPSLEELILDHNLISQLPASLAGLKKLKLLSVADNRLTSIPDELVSLPKLQKLAVNRNMLIKLPLYLGNLTSLKSLWINNNCIDELPWTMGRLEGLKELMIGDNPVESRWKGVLEGEGKIPRMLQIMRELRLRALHGEPPDVSIVTTGLFDEIIVPLPRKAKLWDQFCKNAASSGYVDLHWNQLKFVPLEILSIRTLVELRVSNNLLEELPDDIGLLNQLKVLHATNNKLRTLPEAALVNLKLLEELCLEDNKIDHIPDKIVRLFRLKILRMSRNRISELPRKFGKMEKLVVVELNVNRLRAIPESIGSLHRLERLCLQKNRIRNLPTDMSRMTSLQVLNVNSNLLREIPSEISSLGKLTELKFGHNRVRRVAENFGDGACKDSLEVLWLMGNHIVDIPRTFHRLHKLKEVRIEDTPIRSPSPELTLQGIDAIRAYSRHRQIRIDCLRVALRTSGIHLDSSKLSPYPRNVLRNTEYLHLKDIKNLEEKIDLCVNGNFDENTQTFTGMSVRLLPQHGRAKQEEQKDMEIEGNKSHASSNTNVSPLLTSLVEKHLADHESNDVLHLRAGGALSTYITDLYELRKHEHDERALNSIISRIEIAKNSKFKFGGLKNTWYTSDVRNWEEGGKAGSVHIVVMSELGMLDPGEIGPQPVGFSKGEIITSAGRFINLYGNPGAKIISHKFQKPAKDDTERSRKKVEGKKVKRNALVIQNVIISVEEYERKKVEDAAILKSNADVKKNVETWLATSYGKMRLKKHVKIQIKNAKEIWLQADKDHKRASSKLVKAEEKLKSIKERIKLFESGEIKTLHQIDSKEHASNLLEIEEIAVDEAKEFADIKKEHLNKCRSRRKQKWSMWLNDCTKDLVEKYKEKAREDLVEKCRQVAYCSGGTTSLRRPWDDKYHRWKRKYEKDLKRRAKQEKEARFQAALMEIEAQRAAKNGGEQKEEIPAYEYDNSLFGQLKGYCQDIKHGLFGACLKSLDQLSELTVRSTRIVYN
jgi:Leucine-rich repeat (LRR) protein